MKYFKIRPIHNTEQYEVSEDNFIAVTGRKYPFEQADEQGKLQQYAICPSCLNPVQLIGISHEISCTPYGKHTGKSIQDLAAWDQRKYEYCPYAVKNKQRHPDDNERLADIDDSVIELYNLLYSQFDRVVYILEKELEIRCTERFWKAALNQFLQSKSYCYPWLSETNLPYIFAYFGVHQQNLFKQRILVDSELYCTLKAIPNVAFSKTNNNKYDQLINKDSFLNLHFRFTDHRQYVDDQDTFHESMLFCIDDRDTNKTIYQKKIEFDEFYFMNLIHKKDTECKRQNWLLDIAISAMRPLE